MKFSAIWDFQGARVQHAGTCSAHSHGDGRGWGEGSSARSGVAGLSAVLGNKAIFSTLFPLTISHLLAEKASLLNMTCAQTGRGAMQCHPHPQSHGAHSHHRQQKQPSRLRICRSWRIQPSQPQGIKPAHPILISSNETSYASLFVTHKGKAEESS